MDRRMISHGIAAMVLCLVLAGPVFADVVVLKDTSRIVGKVVKVADGKWTIETEFAGTISIDAESVSGVEFADPMNVRFDSGDQLVGTMQIVDDPGKSKMATKIGEIDVNVADVSLVWPEGEEDPVVLAERAELEKMKPKWDVVLEAGGTFKEGNTDSLEARGKFTVKRSSVDDLLTMYLSGDYSEQDDARSRNEIKGGVWYEHNISKKWFWYTRLDLEYDEFENIDMRSTATAGAGYYWLKKPTHELKTRGGIGYQHVTYSDDNSDSNGVLDLGLDYLVDITEWLRFTHSTNYYPAFEDFDDYRLNLDTAILIPLASSDRWKFKLGMLNDYNNRPQPGNERLDNTYYANIVVDIK